MLRNKEIRQFTILFLSITVIAVTLGFLIDSVAGILVLALVIVFGTMFFVYTQARYQSIARIAEQINLVLHNEDVLIINEFEEGELSILQSEVEKMTLRIREQNDTLKKEKTHLADSLADIAHQLRTPLTSVSLLLSLLANSTDDNQRKEFARETEELLVRMDWLITSLLKISRLDAGIVAFQSEPVEVDNLLREALRPFQIQMELHEIDLQIDTPQSMVVQGDPGWLSEAIQNILKNCIDSAGDHGKIEIVGTDNSLYGEIAIHDNGAGFEDEDIPRLFDRFYRGKNRSTSGYGIGLALCRMIITRQGGTISARNHPQGGAEFIIRFPK